MKEYRIVQYGKPALLHFSCTGLGSDFSGAIVAGQGDSRPFVCSHNNKAWYLLEDKMRVGTDTYDSFRIYE